MGLRINTNVASLSAQRHLANATARVMRSMERLSSGLRINRAADDPAGLAISEKLRSQIRGLDVATRNAADGISVLQVADGALDTVGSLLLRLNELAVQAMNGTVNDDQRGNLDAEFQSLLEEIDRIADSTSFNGMNLLDGSGGAANVQVGIGTGSDSYISLGFGSAFGVDALGLTGLTLAGDPGSWATQPVEALKAAQSLVSHGRAEFGAKQNRLESSIRLIQNQIENLSAADSRIRDLDYAAEMSEFTSAQILQQAAIAVLAQANRQPALILQLLGIK